MADILIRGMEMPTEHRTEVIIFSSGFVAYYDVYGRYLGQARATQLPEGHGRLIDADELMNRARGCLDELTILSLEFLVNGSSTIVPAEGGNTDGN